MDDIEFVSLFDVPEKRIIELMNNDQVGRKLPLLTGGFSAESCRTFLAAKKQLWDEHGFGPWAFLIRNEFAGWGGLQPEQGEADFALVLHPNYWGWGRKIFDKVREQAFNRMNIGSITVLLPPSRQNFNAVARLGFKDDGQLTIQGEVFMRFRLVRP